MAEDALAVALGAYVQGREDIPVPEPASRGQEIVAVPLVVAANWPPYATPGCMAPQDHCSVTNPLLASTIGNT